MFIGLAQKNANIPVHDGSNTGMDHDSDASSDEQMLGGSRERSIAMVFDRSLVGDRNGLKTAILKSVYENQIHLQARKGEAFDSLAERLGQTEEFKGFNLHGRKLQKSFNKIARDIKDCIVAGNEPTRWGKEEPEFFSIARKIFEEARRAGIRAFDEKLKSKSIEDRLQDGGDKLSNLEELNKKRKKRDLETAMGSSYTQNPHVYEPPVDWVRLFDEYLENKMENIKAELVNAVNRSKVPRAELEAGILRSAEQLNNMGIKSIHDLLLQSGISDQGRQKITENCGFQLNDDISIFLLSYTDAISKDTHPVSAIRDQFDQLSSRDAATLYSYIGKVTK